MTGWTSGCGARSRRVVEWAPPWARQRLADRVQRLRCEIGWLRGHGEAQGGAIERECVQDATDLEIVLQEEILERDMYAHRG